MFYDCKYLKDIKELEYLNVNDVKDFSDMFNGCSSLTNIKALENGMFQMVINLNICSMDVHHYQILYLYKIGMFQIVKIFHLCSLDAQVYQILNLYNVGMSQMVIIFLICSKNVLL